MFKKIIISDQSTIDFWKSKSAVILGQNFGSNKFNFEKLENETIIRTVNDGRILDPGRYFVEARIKKDAHGEYKIIIGPKKMIDFVYRILGLGFLLFAILQFKTNLQAAIFMIIAFGFIFKFNFEGINHATKRLAESLEREIGL